jgi:hypothetical protein
MPLAISIASSKVVAGNDRNHGAEDFFLRDAHLGIDVGEDRRLDEPAVLVIAFVEAIAAAHQLRAFVLADLDVLFRSVFNLISLTCGAHLDRLVEAVADFQLSWRARRSSFDELGGTTPFCTMMRLVAVQRWPVVPNAPQSPPSRRGRGWRRRARSSDSCRRVRASNA